MYVAVFVEGILPADLLVKCCILHLTEISGMPFDTVILLREIVS